MRRSWLFLPFVCLASPATAIVIVLGNHRTGEVVIQGNWPDGSEIKRAVALANGGPEAGWIQIWGPDDDRPGWGAVLCVQHKKGIFFAETIGNPSEAEALRVVNMKADRFLARLTGSADADLIERSASWPELARQASASGLGTKVECAPTWNNQGQKIEFVGKPLSSGAVVAGASTTDAPQTPMPQPQESVVAAPEAPKRDYEAEYREKMRVWQAEKAEVDRKVAEFEEAQRQAARDRAANAERARAAEEAYQRQLQEHMAAVAATAEEHRRRQAEYQQQLARLQTPEAPSRIGEGRLRCAIPEDEIRVYRECDDEGGAPDVASGGGNGGGAAGGGAGSGGTGVNYGQPPAPGMTLHLEAVTVCSLEGPQAKFGNWRCFGPLQMNYVNFDKPNWRNALQMTTGGSNPPRDLGMTGSFRVFGWQYPLYKHPDQERDAALKHGVPSIPSRFSYWCPNGKTKGCTRN